MEKKEKRMIDESGIRMKEERKEGYYNYSDELEFIIQSLHLDWDSPNLVKIWLFESYWIVLYFYKREEEKGRGGVENI